MPEEDHSKVWDLIDEWSREAGEAAKATLRERIRRFEFTRRGRRRELGYATRDREAYDSLRPDDPVIRYSWLFASQRVQESDDEIEEEDFDYKKRNERIDRLRREAMTEIWTERGFEGVKKVLAGSGAADTVGHYAASCVTDVSSRADFIRRCLSLDGGLQSKAECCLQGFLLAIGDETRAGILQAVAEELPAEERRRLFVCAPFQASTWRLLDGYSEDIRSGYWKDVFPSCSRHTPAELTELVDCLLEVQRPRAAFHAVVRMDFKDIETSRLKRLLRDVRCPPWRAKRRRVVPGSREATRDTRRAEGAKGDPKGASERGVQSYGRPVCSRNELAMLWRNAG